MKVADAEVVQAQEAQRQASKRATRDNLTKKKRSELEVTITLEGEETTLLFRAIGMRAYDDLLALHPPTKEQQALGATYNGDTFGPALVAAVCVEPNLSETETKEMWESDDWSRGDLAVLWEAALEVNMRGFNVPFSKRG